jgi:hypothetical protein
MYQQKQLKQSIFGIGGVLRGAVSKILPLSPALATATETFEGMEMIGY